MLIYSQPYRRKTDRLNVTLTKEKGGYLLVVDALRNAPETLYRLAAVLFVHEWNITHADICTLENLEIIDKFLVRPVDSDMAVDELKFENMMFDFEQLLFESPSVSTYLKEREAELRFDATGAGQVEFYLDANRTYIMLSGFDRPGLLLSITQVFAFMEIDILEARIHTAPGGQVRNSFLLNPTDGRFKDPRFRERLSDGLRMLL